MKKNMVLIIGLAALLIIGLIYKITQKTSPPSPSKHETKEIYNFDPSLCPGKNTEFAIQDPYLRGIVEQGSKVTVSLNWYECNKPERGDLVLYRFSQHEDPVVRRVVGLPGDEFELRPIAKQGWELLIKRTPVTGVSKPYYFGVDTTPPPLALAAKARNGILSDKEVILFSSFGPGDRDSGTFGVISTKDVVGKVIALDPKTKGL